MGQIKLLDSDTIDRIAAGEVIDRPASVVKELMENAIDAGADRVSVEITGGGISSVRVTDNGCGIDAREIRCAFLRHSTSKIEDAEDLLGVSSLGFRGEALSSIAAVSRVELITKTALSLTGIRYKIAGGAEESLEEIGAPDGTTFLVSDLFYNTPARRKFLKTAHTEAGAAADVVEKIALSSPEIAIRFVSDHKERLATSGNGNAKDVIYRVYGRETASRLIPVSAEYDTSSIEGWIGTPDIARGNRGFEICFVNGRFIKSDLISGAVEEAFKPYMMQHRYPFAVLYINILPQLLDVNVHPAKLEVRFSDPVTLRAGIVETLRNALKSSSLIPSVSFDSGTDKKDRDIKDNVSKSPEPFETNRIRRAGDEKKNRENTQEKAAPEKSSSYSYRTSVNHPVSYLSDVTKAETDETPSYTPVAMPSDGLAGRFKDRASGISKRKAPDFDVSYENLTLFENDFLKEKDTENLHIIGQIFETYWIAGYKDQMLIIDQHAAHEKVLYEELKSRLKTKTVQSQYLNPPVILSLTIPEAAVLDQFTEALSGTGFDIEPFGGREYAVRAVPLDLYALNVKDLIMDIIDGLKSESTEITSELLESKIASMACKAAVKGNFKLTQQEAQALFKQLLTLENPYNCPHGRPTMISMSKRELEKKFKRIV